MAEFTEKVFAVSDIGAGVIGDRPACYGVWRRGEYVYIGQSLAVESRLMEDKKGRGNARLFGTLFGSDVEVRIWYLEDGIEDREEVLREHEESLIKAHDPVVNAMDEGARRRFDS